MRWRLATVCVALVACGDELADAEYRGQPLFVLAGPVDFPEGLDFLQVARCEERTHACFLRAEETCGAEDDGCFESCEGTWDRCISALEDAPVVDSLDGIELRLGLFWSRAGVQGGAAAAADRVEQTARIEAGFPARYRLILHTPPPSDVLKKSGAGEYAIGLVLVYIDGNRDGRFSPGVDQITGGAAERAVLYTPDGVELGDQTWTAGYHRVQTGQICDEAVDGGRIIDLDVDPAPTLRVELSAGPGFLRALLLDEDCDCELDGYDDLCPPEEELESFCDSGDGDPGVCELCFDLLFGEGECEQGPPGGGVGPDDDVETFDEDA